MKTVYKYEILPLDYFYIEMPINAKILKIDTQRGVPQIWALVDKDGKKTEKRYFRLAGTGHDIKPEESICYLDTVKLSDDYLIFHLFEIKNINEEIFELAEEYMNRLKEPDENKDAIEKNVMNYFNNHNN